MTEKICCFFWHRYAFMCKVSRQKLKETIEKVILKGFTVFYHGYHGHFDDLCLSVVLELKKQYPHIKLIKILSSYNPKETLSKNYESIFPDMKLVIINKE